jgi:hypothetical protein
LDYAIDELSVVTFGEFSSFIFTEFILLGLYRILG